MAGWQVRFEVPAVADSRFTQGSVDGVEKSCLALAAESHLCAGCCDLRPWFALLHAIDFLLAFAPFLLVRLFLSLYEHGFV